MLSGKVASRPTRSLMLLQTFVETCLSFEHPRKILVCPCLGGTKGFGQGPAKRCDGILHPEGRCYDHPSLNDSIALKPAQALCQRLLGDSGDTAPDLIEANSLSPSAERAQHENGPLIGELVEDEPANLYGVDIVSSGHRTFPPGNLVARKSLIDTRFPNDTMWLW